jgi:hypothetical protein
MRQGDQPARGTEASGGGSEVYGRSVVEGTDRIRQMIFNLFLNSIFLSLLSIISGFLCKVFFLKYLSIKKNTLRCLAYYIFFIIVVVKTMYFCSIEKGVPYFFLEITEVFVKYDIACQVLENRGFQKQLY